MNNMHMFSRVKLIPSAQLKLSLILSDLFQEYVFDLDRVKQEVSIEEDKVLTER